MKISILSLFLELYKPFFNTSLIKRACEKGIISYQCINLFDMVQPKERVDAPIYGPGSGMLIKPQVIEQAIMQSESIYGPAFKIFFTPQGKKCNQSFLSRLVNDLRSHKHILLLASRYEGIDERVEEYYADLSLSVGDFVVMGGDVPAMLFLEGFLRLLPGVVGKEESVVHESFSGPFFDWPAYTEPVEWKGMKVPEVVRSGDHTKIAKWREERAIKKTVKNNFSWLRNYALNTQHKKQVRSFIPAHYIVLMHDQVKLPKGRIGTTSVTSIDIHDIARSARTYDITQYFIVTPLKDQQKIVTTLMDFWLSDVGIEYNPQRHEALSRVRLCNSLKESIQTVIKKEQKNPIIMGTSARSEYGGIETVFYDEQEKIWSQDRPVLIIFGTGNGLSDKIFAVCDYMLPSLEGVSDFNHLSVRSAAGIVLDRWLGLYSKYPD